MRFKIICCLLCVFTIFGATAHPKITIKNQRNEQNLAEIKVLNETTESLLCYVAIDGYKIKFKLAPRGQSEWYKATDPRFNHKSFSVRCDFIVR